MKVERLRWYARRARTMEQGELRARLAGALERVADYVRWRVAGRNLRPRPIEVERFRFCRSDEPLLPEFAWNFPPPDAEIAAILDGTHRALGFPWAWQPGRQIWHRAPDTGRLWPETFSDLIDYRPGNPVGDARVMWDPNRLQQLVALALIAKFVPARAEAAVGLLTRQLRDWIGANPLRLGVNYTASMECALRILSVCFASDLARHRLRGDSDFWAAVAALVLEHAAFVSARLSLFSSLGNHTVAECAGLFVAALLFPEAPESRLWEAQASAVLERAARRVILEDGGSAEQALGYHAQSLDHLEIASRVGTHFGRDMGALDAIRDRAGAFLRAFGADRRRLPRIGDGDDGYALSHYFAPDWAARPAPEPRPADISLWTGGGYSILRSMPDKAEIVFDHGPLGMAPNYGHGHADALALQLRIDGEPIFVDPGTYGYGLDARWRNYFRSTAAHNTVTVDARSQAEDVGAFLWQAEYRCDLVRAELDGGSAAIVVACHDGYRRAGVLHTRGVKLLVGAILVLDRLTGRGTHELALRWHFACALSAGKASRFFETSTGVRCLTKGGAAAIHVGVDAPPAGWFSDCYGIKRPIHTLELRCSTTLPHEFLTIFALPTSQAAIDVRQHLENLREAMRAPRPADATPANAARRPALAPQRQGEE